MNSDAMTFTAAVRHGFVKYADFSGCASRSEYWWWSLFSLVGTLGFEAVSDQLSLAFSIATLLPGVAVTTRRLHDTDRSGWLQLLWFVPIVGWILLLIWCAEPGKPNRYGSAAAGPPPRAGE